MLTREQRLRLATLLENVVEQRVSPAEALNRAEVWTVMPWNEKIVERAYHALQHYHIDEDIRGKDPNYDASLKKGLLEIAGSLRLGLE